MADKSIGVGVDVKVDSNIKNISRDFDDVIKSINEVQSHLKNLGKNMLELIPKEELNKLKEFGRSVIGETKTAQGLHGVAAARSKLTDIISKQPDMAKSLGIDKYVKQLENYNKIFEKSTFDQQKQHKEAHKKTHDVFNDLADTQKNQAKHVRDIQKPLEEGAEEIPDEDSLPF